MKLVYKANGTEVKVGDSLNGLEGFAGYVIDSIEKPKSPASTGRVYVRHPNNTKAGFGQGYYPSVIQAEWIEREDREDTGESPAHRIAIWLRGNDKRTLHTLYEDYRRLSAINKIEFREMAQLWSQALKIYFESKS